MSQDTLNQKLPQEDKKKKYTFNINVAISWVAMIVLSPIISSAFFSDQYLSYSPITSLGSFFSFAGLFAYLLNTFITLKGRDQVNKVFFYLVSLVLVCLFLGPWKSLGAVGFFLSFFLVCFIISMIITSYRIKKVKQHNASL